jgi:hypothetical protein
MADLDPIKAARDEGFTDGTIAALGVITAMDCPVTWAGVVRAAGTQNVLRRAIAQEGDWEWAGFKKYAVSELGRAEVAKARRAVRAERTSGVSVPGHQTFSQKPRCPASLPVAEHSTLFRA